MKSESGVRPGSIWLNSNTPTTPVPATIATDSSCPARPLRPRANAMTTGATMIIPAARESIWIVHRSANRTPWALLATIEPGRAAIAPTMTTSQAEPADLPDRVELDPTASAEPEHPLGGEPRRDGIDERRGCQRRSRECRSPRRRNTEAGRADELGPPIPW